VSSATPRTTSSVYIGAYGFRIEGLDGARSLLVEAPEQWPRLGIVVESDAPGPPCDRLGPDRAELRLSGGGWVGIDRQPGRAVYHLPRPLDAGALVHPYLAPVALVAARWLGRESFHAGAFATADGAWALLGDKEAGKSTTLAWLLAHGHEIVCDDALILDGPNALAGPRSIDLRAESARRLGIGDPLGTVGVRERWRIQLDPIPAELPLKGWVTLEWADATAVEPIRGTAKLAALTPHRGVFIEPPRPELLIDYAALPHWRLRRPRSWEAIGASVERLLEALSRS
jgi:hypothetical protein